MKARTIIAVLIMVAAMAFASCSNQQPPDPAVPLSGQPGAEGADAGNGQAPGPEDGSLPGGPGGTGGADGTGGPGGADGTGGTGGTDGTGGPGGADNPPGSVFTIWFIDVGRADSALVVCDGHAMLIDGGNPGDSSLIYSFLQSHGIRHLDYIVATHPHKDHVGGLPGALNFATVGTVLSPVGTSDLKAFEIMSKYLDGQGIGVTVPCAGDEFRLGTASVKILGPINDSEDTNNTSIVLRVVYGKTSFLFTGDAGREEEADILETGYDLKSTVLKVGHHGSNSSTTYPFLREVMPDYAVIPVKEEGSNGVPGEKALSRLRDAGAAVFRTDVHGTVTCVSDGETVIFTTEKNVAPLTGQQILDGPDVAAPGSAAPGSAAPGSATPGSAAPSDTEGGAGQNHYAYIGNINSQVFHSPGCRSLPLEKNRVYFDERDEAVAKGFRPCGLCNP